MPIFRPYPIMTAAAVLGLAVLIALGTWQLGRRAEKQAFLAAVAAKSALPPVPLEEALAHPDPRYVRVRIDAPANCEAQVLVNAFQVWSGKTIGGGKLVTPVKMTNGSWLMVDRGFLPEDVLAERGGRIESVSCTFSVEGVAVLTPSSPGGWFTPSADRGGRRWFAFDAEDIGRANGLAPVAPWFARLLPPEDPEPDSWPSPEVYAADIRDNHLTYAMTWFGLALTLIGVYVAFHISAGRLGFSK